MTYVSWGKKFMAQWKHNTPYKSYVRLIRKEKNIQDRVRGLWYLTPLSTIFQLYPVGPINFLSECKHQKSICTLWKMLHVEMTVKVKNTFNCLNCRSEWIHIKAVYQLNKYAVWYWRKQRKSTDCCDYNAIPISQEFINVFQITII